MTIRKAKNIDLSQFPIRTWHPQGDSACTNPNHTAYTYTNMTSLVDLFEEGYSARCTFVVNTCDNQLKLSKQSNLDPIKSCGKQIGGHMHLAKCDNHASTCDTYISGEAFFKNGKLYKLTNKSGGFRTNASETMNYTIYRFRQAAKSASLNRAYGVVKYQDCVTNEETLFDFS
jgi:hypothetical protein